ncbi:MAG: 4'-phosphopantetheinyl transferase superfamily protein [Pseudomonadales bacterium]|nr:4'-phosphopantetheinyl transferase superfamily protein [Pseudomonadales bacterium]
MAGSSSACSPEATAPQIWLARVPEQQPEALPDWLSREEQQRAASHHGTGRLDFLHSRWLIRQALGHAAGRPPEQCRPVSGRPVAAAAPAGWRLSLSHSHGVVACATAWEQPLGIDLEPLGRHSRWRRVVQRWFSESEQAWLLAEQDASAFLRCWTLKEAWLKATGRGIAGNLQTLEIDADGQLHGDLSDPDWWAISTTTGGFQLALVYRCPTGVTKPTQWLVADPQLSLATAAPPLSAAGDTPFHTADGTDKPAQPCPILPATGTDHD